MNIRLHSRHIPREHLNFSTTAAHAVEANGLCDTLIAENAQMLLKNDVTVIETRFTWNEITDDLSAGFNRLENVMTDIESSGLRIGLFCWFQYPPNGYEDISYLQCLEHHEKSTVASLWDPRTIQNYDRLYCELSRRYKERISFLYVGVYGDYGEVCFPSGVKHYNFSPRHGHPGLFCDDSFARADFLHFLQTKYLSLSQLNDTWKTDFCDWKDDFMPCKSINLLSSQRQKDFIEWYCGSITKFCNQVCETVQRYFPDTPKGLPIGFPDESLEVGQIKSDIVQIAARHQLVARWTGLGFLNDFGKSDVLAKRVSCAARFYGAPFGTEAALKLTADNAANAAYECVANGAILIHNDPENIRRGNIVWNYLVQHMRVSPPVQKVGIFYPLEGEMTKSGFDTALLPYEQNLYGEECGIGDAFSSSGIPSGTEAGLGKAVTLIDSFILRCAALRHYFDYALFDSHMMLQGFGKQIDTILFVISSPLPKSFCEELELWIQNGGSVLIREGVRLSVWEDGEEYIPGGAKYFSDPPEIQPYASLKRKNGWDASVYVTIHEDFVSVLNPNEFEVAKQIQYRNY